MNGPATLTTYLHVLSAQQLGEAIRFACVCVTVTTMHMLLHAVAVVAIGVQRVLI